MTYKAPHFGNLQKRANALGMKVTRVTTDEEARMFGGHEYVLTQANASQSRIDNASRYTLAGIRREIESFEAVHRGAPAVDEYPEVKDPCGNVVKPSDPDYLDCRAFESNAGISVAVRELKELMSGVGVAHGEAVIDALSRQYASGGVDMLKDAYRKDIIRGIGGVVGRCVEFEEAERPSFSMGGEMNDLVIRGRVRFMSETQWLAIMAKLKEISR